MASCRQLKEKDFPVFVAKYSYWAQSTDQLNFKKGDLLYIIETIEEGWWYARSKRSGQEGYVPNNYVTKYKSLDAEE